MAGIWFRRASTSLVTSLVRATDAPSGNCTSMKNAPWSSSGRKPVGVSRDTPNTPAANTNTSTSDSTAIRTNRRTMPA
jgi:hypothetical protein